METIGGKGVTQRPVPKRWKNENVCVCMHACVSACTKAHATVSAGADLFKETILIF